MADHLENEVLRRTFAELGFITNSDALIPVLRRARKAACVSDITVLLEGETGTGKQVLAQAIHSLDQKRGAHPFITVHCGTISESVAESEFFGHQKGAFSGAVASRKGLFQSARMGAIFLDDINDLPMALQAKLLDVIQRKMVRPVGGDQEFPVDVRIIAASNQPLKPLVMQNRFRADLYHRLDVVRLPLIPLRERAHDLVALMIELARRHTDLYAPIDGVEADLVAMLEAHAFPGNIRELENAVQRMLFLKADGATFEMNDWLAAQAESENADVLDDELDPLDEAAGRMWQAISQNGVAYADALRRVEKKVLETALSHGGPTRREIAKRLSTSERTLYHKIRAHRLGAQIST